MSKSKTKTETLYISDEAKKILKKRKRKRIIIGVAIGLIFVFFIMQRIKKKPEIKRDDIIAVQVEQAKKGDIQKIIRINGEIKAKFGASVFSDVSGRVRAVLRREGSVVSQGEALLLIDRRSMGVDYMDFIVKSPISGVVGSVDVEVGYTIGLTTQLMKVVNPRIMECIVDVVEKDIGIVKNGMNAIISVDAYDKKFEGIITNVSTIVHPITRTVQVTIAVDNEKYRETPLKDGMYANASIVVETKKDVPIIPYSVILDKDGEKYLFVVKKIKENNQDKWIAERRVVTTGIVKREQIENDFVDYIEIVKGLQSGEIVVTMGHRFLQDKALVDIRTAMGEKINPQRIDKQRPAVPEEIPSPPTEGQRAQQTPQLQVPRVQQQRTNTVVQPQPQGGQEVQPSQPGTNIPPRDSAPRTGGN